jgi:hypothetical protein
VGLTTGRTAYTDPVHNVVQIDASAGARSEGADSAGVPLGASTAGGGSGNSGAGGTALADSGGPNLHQLFHEATHQIVFAVTRFSFSGGGTVPGWLGEGLAEYVSGGMHGPPGKRKFAEGLIILERFQVHAAAKSPYDLSRVLTFEADDFVASSKADLKYAQAYTLVQFCMEGEGGKYRKAFLEFLRGAWKGRASAGDFRKAMKISDREFEKTWIAHARANSK